MIDRAWLWVGAAAIGFGVGFPLSKWLLVDQGVSVWQLFLPRFSVATAIVVVLLGRRVGIPDRSTFLRGGLLGLINMAVATILLSLATDLLPASVVGVLTAFIPLATVTAAHHFVPGERFVAAMLPGLIFGVIGVVFFVVGGRDADGSTLNVVGVLVSLAGVAAAGVGGALNRRFAAAGESLDLVIPQFVVAALVTSAVAIPLGGADLGGFDSTTWLGLVGLGVVSTALPFYSLLRASETARASRVATVGYLTPIIGAGSSIVLLDEPISGGFLIGTALVAIGVGLSARIEPAAHNTM